MLPLLQKTGTFLAFFSHRPKKGTALWCLSDYLSIESSFSLEIVAILYVLSWDGILGSLSNNDGYENVT